MNIKLLKETVELLKNRFNIYFPDIKLNESKTDIIIEDNKNYSILTHPHGSIWQWHMELKSPWKEKATELENLYDWKLIKDILKDLKSKNIKYKYNKSKKFWQSTIELFDLNLVIHVMDDENNKTGSPVYVTYLRSEQEKNHLQEVLDYLNLIRKQDLELEKYKYWE